MPPKISICVKYQNFQFSMHKSRKRHTLALLGGCLIHKSPIISLTLSKTLNSLLILIALLFFIFRSLNPLLRSGFYADDMSNSLSWTSVVSGGPSRYQMLINGTPSGPVPGRFYPLSNYAYFLFDFVHGNAVLYKLIILVCIIASLFLFALFILEAFGRKDIAIFSILTLPLFMQFRIFYDPITSFHAFMQILFIFLILTLIFLNRYLQTKRLVYLLSSLCSFIITLFLYEISLMFMLIVFFFILRSNKHMKEKFTYIFIYFIPLTTAILLSLRERRRYESMPAYQTNFNIFDWFPALIRQIYASFPLSYYKSNPGDIFDHNINSLLEKITFSDRVTVLLFVVITVVIIKRTNWINPRKNFSRTTDKVHRKLRNKKNRDDSIDIVKNVRVILFNEKDLLMFGLLLLITPNLLIALSPTYQYLIYWGVGHIPVYISYFGAYLILSFLTVTILSKQKYYRKIGIFWLLMAIISAGYLVNFQNNRQIIETQNQTYWYKRTFLESMQKKSNFLQRIPENSLILFSVDDNLSLDVGPFIFSLTGKQIQNVDTRRLLPWYKNMKNANTLEKYKTEDPVYWDRYGTSEKDLFSKYSRVFIIKYWSDSFEKGYVTLSEISSLVLDNEDKATFVKVIQTEIYLLNTEPQITELYFKTFSCPQLISNCLTKPVNLLLGSKEKLSLQSKYAVFSVDLQNADIQSSDWIDFKSIQIGGMDKIIE